VAPTRRARNGSLYVSPKNLRGLKGHQGGKFVISISGADFKEDPKPIDPGCGCFTCQNYSRSYLRHLYMASEILYHRLATIHNVYFMNNLMEQIREAIENKQFKKLKTKWLE
jgi:queuine tRNA-ribosyltransferase